MKKVFQYIAFLSTFILSDFVSTWGSLFTLKFPNMTMWEAFKQAIPWAWITWLLTTISVHISDKYKLATPIQVTFLMMIDQFIATVVVNKYWLHQKISRSDYVTFFVILFGFYVSFFRVVTKIINREEPPKGLKSDKRQ